MLINYCRSRSIGLLAFEEMFEIVRLSGGPVAHAPSVAHFHLRSREFPSFQASFTGFWRDIHFQQQNNLTDIYLVSDPDYSNLKTFQCPSPRKIHFRFGNPICTCLVVLVHKLLCSLV